MRRYLRLRRWLATRGPYLGFVVGLAVLLVFSEVDYPGWQATVDGEPTQLVRADYVLRVICVPPGEHRVVVRYLPLILRVGALITGLAVMGIAVTWVWSFGRRGGLDGT